MAKEFVTTTNSRVFRILYKNQYASCSHCTWHSRWFGKHNENDFWTYYCLDTDPDERGNMTKLPNWKLCSKNKKQWMKKPLRYREQKRYRNEHPLYVIEW